MIRAPITGRVTTSTRPGDWLPPVAAVPSSWEDMEELVPRRSVSSFAVSRLVESRAVGQSQGCLLLSNELREQEACFSRGCY